MSQNTALPGIEEPLEGSDLAASLTVRDLEHSAAWYRQTLGFTVDRQHERQGRLVAISLKAGTVNLLLTQDDGAKGLDRAKGDGFSLQISTTQSADSLAARARRQGAVLDTEPTDTPWGPRIFRVRDPDGFRWTISSTSSTR
jgi:uncharacterized glyoxalase superfamily protein PhnB